MRGWLSNITYANVTATLALIVALSGTAYAATTIGTNQIQNGAVTTPKIKNAAVTTPKIKNAAVNSAKLKNAAVTTPKLADQAVTSAKLARGSLRADLFAAGQTPGVNPAKIFFATTTATVGQGRPGLVFANCPEDTFVIGESYSTDAGAVVTSSQPTTPADASGRSRGWTFGVSVSDAFSHTFTATAVCVAP